MKSIKIISILTIIVFFTSGCTKYPYDTYPKKLSKKSYIEIKNYKLNTKSLAFVGQPLLRVKSEEQRLNQIIEVKTNNSFSINIRNDEFFIDTNTKYRVNALIVYNNLKHNLINIDAGKELTYSYVDDYYLIVDDKGNVLPKLWKSGEIINAKLSEENLKVTLTPKKVYMPEKYSKGSLNIELLYNGTNKDGVKLLYREYTSDNLARQAFYQNLIYDKDEKQIRFKNFLIEMHSSNNQEIVYTILRDDFKEDVILIE